MSGEHYNCFYDWDDLGKFIEHLDQVYAVASDFDQMDMHEAADLVRETANYLDYLRTAWQDGIVPKLCHHMDWYQSLDSSEDTLRAQVSKELGHRLVSVRVFKNIGKVEHNEVQAWVYNQRGTIMRELSGDWEKCRQAILLAATEDTVFKKKTDHGWVVFDPRVDEVGK